MDTSFDFNVASPIELLTADAGRRGVQASLEVERRRRWKPFAQRVALFSYDVAREKWTSNDQQQVAVERFRKLCEVDLDRQMADAPQRLVFQMISRRVISRLRIDGKCYRWLNNLTHCWQMMPKYDWDVELTTDGLAWFNEDQPRTLIYNQSIGGANRSSNLCLFDCVPGDLLVDKPNSAALCLAVGLMMEEFDTGRADESSTTTGHALHRIKSAFAKHKAKPKMFFVGAAVATKMAAEIWAMLKKGDLDNAANLTDDNQLAAVTRWLCSL